MAAIYDKIGVGYSVQRTTDPHMAKQIWAALGNPKTLLNVGAGTGSYELETCQVVSIEPSLEMIKQRRSDAAPVIHGPAEDIPFADNQFDVAMGILTIHHWTDQAKGMAEMMRVARDRVVLLTHDPEFSGFWLQDYLPELFAVDQKSFPAMGWFKALASNVTIEPVTIPHDCIDGHLGAYWRRPEAYLDPQVRAATSIFAKLENSEAAIGQLAADLESGAWTKKYGSLLALSELDLGYKLVTISL